MAIVGACADSDRSIDIVCDPCQPVIVQPAASPTAIQAAGIATAIELWRAVGITTIQDTPVSSDNATTLVIHFQAASPAFRGLYDDEARVIYINDGLTDAGSLGIVIAHELGHAFGLEHVRGVESLMVPGNLSIPPTDADLASLTAKWGTCSTP